MVHHGPFEFPEMAYIRQQSADAGVSQVSEAVDRCLRSLPELPKPGKNARVAVAVGSRHIDNLPVVVDRCLRYLEKNGFQPFIVPAMGSHGGGTAEGQSAVLAACGITPESMGVPVIGEMDTEAVAVHLGGLPLFVSKAALSADYQVLINRIKPHTKFKAEIASGLCKMMTIGLGKKEGAAAFHQYAVDHGFGIIEEAARMLLKHLNLLFGVGLLENSAGRLAEIAALSPDHLITREKDLLRKAARMMGQIPFDPLDILIIDHFGKNISGIGMDSNVTGRHRDIVGDFFTAPHVKRIFVRDLSPASDGNANGIGLADFTTRRLVDRMDVAKTYVNAITAISPEKAAIPVHFETDRECLDACARTTGVADPRTLRVVRIKSTAALDCIQVSRSLESEMLKQSHLSRISPWQPLTFSSSGNLGEFLSDPSD